MPAHYILKYNTKYVQQGKNLSLETLGGGGGGGGGGVGRYQEYFLELGSYYGRLLSHSTCVTHQFL